MKASAEKSGFIHNFVAGPSIKGSTTLLLLHGTGGNEKDLLPLGRTISPEANLLSPRGTVLENGMPRFFRRLSEGVFDPEDLRRRTQELADFTEKSSLQYGFDLDKVIAVGFSNGANIAASLLLLFPRLLTGAILFRPMVPIEPAVTPDLSRVSALILAGLQDNIVPKDEPERLANMLKEAGADVMLIWQDAGHGIGGEDVLAARDWLKSLALDSDR